MRVKIDKDGRFVLPKLIRDHFGLKKGSKLELEETEEGIILKPLPSSEPVQDEQC